RSEKKSNSPVPSRPRHPLGPAEGWYEPTQKHANAARQQRISDEAVPPGPVRLARCLARFPHPGEGAIHSPKYFEPACNELQSQPAHPTEHLEQALQPSQQTAQPLRVSALPAEGDQSRVSVGAGFSEGPGAVQSASSGPAVCRQCLGDR